jgi:hypothetical protein
VSITRDTRPVDPEDQARREKLNALGKTLRDLHATLLKVVQRDYETVHGPVGGPLKLFGLVTGDPFFVWLRPLSGQMALIDERIDDKVKLEPADLEGIRGAVDELFKPSKDSPEGFASNYHARVESEPTVTGLHAELRGRLEDLSQELA